MLLRRLRVGNGLGKNEIGPLVSKAARDKVIRLVEDAKAKGAVARPGGDREMVEILALVLHHDEQAVLCAVELAIEAGVATKTHVLNVLNRLTDGKALSAAPIDTPQALRLNREPLANVERYDALRDREQRHAS